MDILTHVISGAAAGTAVSSFSKNGLKHRLKIIIASGIAGALPDIDTLSLWSGFDSTIGKFLHLSSSGKVIYSAKFWYSHHGFMHSIAAGILIPLSAAVLFYLISSGIHSLSLNRFILFVQKVKLLVIGFFLGFLIHLIEDMPTPASSWGGVDLFWPSKSYIGGTGDIWWWNNYDIFLIVLSVFLFNSALVFSIKFLRIDIRKVTVTFLLLGFAAGYVQVKTRGFSFSYSGRVNRYQEFEVKSKELQENILGKKLYDAMSGFDKKLKINF